MIWSIGLLHALLLYLFQFYLRIFYYVPNIFQTLGGDTKFKNKTTRTDLVYKGLMVE